eukprot:gene10867-3485_t
MKGDEQQEKKNRLIDDNRNLLEIEDSDEKIVISKDETVVVDKEEMLKESEAIFVYKLITKRTLNIFTSYFYLNYHKFKVDFKFLNVFNIGDTNFNQKKSQVDFIKSCKFFFRLR